MTPDSHALYVWAAIAGLAVVVLGSRSCFMLLPRRLRPGPRAEAWLRYAPLAALAALVVPESVEPVLRLLADPGGAGGVAIDAAASGGAAAGDAVGSAAGLEARAVALLADARTPSALVLVAVGVWRRSSLAGLLAGVGAFLALRAVFGAG